jgi:hypothetical protein
MGHTICRFFLLRRKQMLNTWPEMRAGQVFGICFVF